MITKEGKGTEIIFTDVDKIPSLIPNNFKFLFPPTFHLRYDFFKTKKTTVWMLFGYGDKPVWDSDKNYEYNYFRHEKGSKNQSSPIKFKGRNSIFIPTTPETSGHCTLTQFEDCVKVLGESWEGWEEEPEEELREAGKLFSWRLMESDKKRNLMYWYGGWYSFQKLTGIKIYTIGGPISYKIELKRDLIIT